MIDIDSIELQIAKSNSDCRATIDVTKIESIMEDPLEPTQCLVTMSSRDTFSVAISYDEVLHRIKNRQVHKAINKLPRF